MNLASLLRHWFTLLATLLTGWFVLPASEQEQLAKALGDLVAPLTLIGTLLVTAGWRLALAWAAKVFRPGTGEMEDGGPSGGMTLLMIGTAAALGTALPSCSIGEYPISGSITYRDEATGAKAGLTFYPRSREVRADK